MGQDILEARRLRSEGKTLSQICAQMEKPKSTVYGWIKDMPALKINGEDIQAKMRREFQEKWQKQGTQRMVQKRQEERDAAYLKGWEEAPSLLSNYSIRDFVTLYLAEGTRKGDHEVCFTNTDPVLICFVLKQIPVLTKKPPKVRLICRTGEETKLVHFWSALLGVEATDIAVYLKKGPTGRRAEFGVIQIRVTNTLAKARLRGWLDRLKEQWGDSSKG